MIRLLCFAAVVVVAVAPPSVDNSPFGAPGNPEPPPFQPQPEVETTTPEATTVASEPPEDTTETATSEPLAPADVAFVIDISYSMHKNMDAVKSAASELLNDLRADGVPIRNMVLSTFYDYEPKNERIQLFVSDDVDKFITHFDELENSKATDCQGASLSGLRNALAVVGKRSFVFVFGDGPPRDGSLKEEIVESLNAQEIMVSGGTPKLHYFLFQRSCIAHFVKQQEKEEELHALIAETQSARLTDLHDPELKSIQTEPMDYPLDLTYIKELWPVIGQDTSVIGGGGSGSSPEEVSDSVKKNIIRKLMVKLKSTMKSFGFFTSKDTQKRFGNILSAVRRTFGLMKLKTLDGEGNSALVDSYAALDGVKFSYANSDLTTAHAAVTSLRNFAESLAGLSLAAEDYTSGIEARYSRLLERKRVVRIGDLGKVLSGCLEAVAIVVEGSITDTESAGSALEETLAELEQLM